jgi:hypothetical protein
MIKITEDNFVWCIVTKYAEKLYPIMSLYELHEDGSESSIDTYTHLAEAINRGGDIAIEGGWIKMEVKVGN